MGSKSSKKDKDPETKQNGSAGKPPPPVPARRKNDEKILRALYDYDSSTSNSGELSFKKDDLFKLKDDSNEDWWLVESVVGGCVGYVPYNYMVSQDSLQQYPWFHGNLNRKECEKLLMREENIIGTFLVRDSESIKGSYSLSLLVCNEEDQRAVKHYHLRRMDSGSWFISPKNSYESIEALLGFYKKNKVLFCKLSEACIKFKPVLRDLCKGTKDKWEIDRNTLRCIEQVGSGNFGEVWKGLWKNKITVAIKMLKQGVAEKQDFLDEAAKMKRLRHPKLIQLYAVCTEQEPLYIVTEFMVNGCLQDLLRKDRGKTIKEKENIEFATQVAQGMKYIEEQGYIHRDLATRNILVDEYMLVKIADFGLSKALSEERVYNAKERTQLPVKWTAIEAITEKKFTIKSDVWSFGILLVELFTYGETPYQGLTKDQVLQKLMHSSFRHPKPVLCSNEMYDLMLFCWHKDPFKRPTFEYLYETLNDFYTATQGPYAS